MFRSEKRSGKPLCLALMLVNLRRNFLCTGACSSAKMKAVMLQSDVPYLVRDCKARTPSFRFHVCVHGICSGTPCLRVGTALGFALRGCDSPGASCRTQEMITEREMSLPHIGALRARFVRNVPPGVNQQRFSTEPFCGPIRYLIRISPVWKIYS